MAEMVAGDRRWWLYRKAMVVLWVSASVGIWVGLHWYIRRVSMRKAEESLVSMCEERARMLQDQFAVSVNHVHALAILVSTFHYQKHPPALDQETFADYTARTAFERPLLSGVAYAQRVVHSERELFESQQGWMIKTMKREPSPVQDEYAPVIYSQETISYIEALDMMSGEEDRENILRARATGKAVLTSPFRLLGSNHLGVVLTFPVYRSGLPADAMVEERVEATAGYLGGAFDVESLVENLLRQLAGNQDIMVNVYDVTNASEPLVMYGSQFPDGYMSFSHVSMLDFGDPFRRHQMECRYSNKPPIPLSAITTPSGVFVICMLAGYILYAAWNRYDNVKEDCRKMEELKKQAEAADVAKSQFLATVSHEIRTPMNGVLGMLDMLLDTNLNLTQKDYAQTAQVCGKALISLINEVLDRAKIEAGKLEIESVPFDLRSILDDVISLFSAKSREKGIELAVYVSDRVPEILMGDPGRFRQIITNLVGNSVKFTERGHIFVQVHLAEHSNTITEAKVETGLNGHSGEAKIISTGTAFDTLSGLEAADCRNSWENFKMVLSHEQTLPTSSGMPNDNYADKVTLMVTVEDTGIGIPFHAQNRVFTPFMQADSSTSRNYGGTGIGLSISKCLVELMGGQINFVSRPHVGSTFTFTAVLQRCDKSAGSDAKRALSEVLPTCFGGTRAILVDRRPVRGAVTRYHLQRLGISVECVSTINEVPNAIQGQNGCLRSGTHSKQPCILLIEHDSWDTKADVCLCNQLIQWKENGRIIEIPKVVLLVTSESDKTKAGSDVDIVIMKPLRASTVAACFQQVLGIGKQQTRDRPKGSASLSGLLDGKNILVVDDNKVNLRVAAGVLKKYGANVECAESGKDALSLLQLPHKFDACFMDVQMPEMDGFEATRQIRLMESKATEKNRIGPAPEEGSLKTAWHLPILAMTADVIQATYEECLKCGMDGYVSKPFEEAQLYQAVAEFLVSDS
ncbi:probable histidine kinase 4 [Elaeis guineensis]|uniref:histidine kinase n=1 Tax=Elaeis guineensis var. tenera TaxID=51953 RepID=A0A6I9SBX3_ELAGV|nr:probable histidine kinase 4 [Elaeis guineensis]XP_029123775.1 probable histidine kinase 4 [Elaeis guineensis]